MGARVATKTFARRQDADRWARAMDADLVVGTAIDPRAGDELLSRYAERWLWARRVNGQPLALRTAELYRDLLERHIDPSSAQLRSRTSGPMPCALGIRASLHA
jgi:hypothetical protein